MRVCRFFHPSKLVVDDTIELSQDATHHSANVLRLKEGCSIVLFDGSGKEFVCELLEVHKRKVIATVHTELSINPESPTPIHLAQGISKGDRMDLVLQKATELGVTEITPLITLRCNVKLDENRWEKKQQQWLKVIINACEQCGRNTLPKLNSPLNIAGFAACSTQQQRIILSPHAEKGLADRLLAAQSPYGYRIVIGPEGGLSEAEVHQLEESGYVAAKFGPRILRTETAAIAALSVIQATTGDMR